MSVPHFHTLKIADIRRETPDCVSIAFEIPDALKEVFRYQAGQYITLKTILNGEEVRRSYSICSSPQEPDFRVAIKEVPGGLFSTYANRTLKKGESLEVMDPMGKFIHPSKGTDHQHYMAFVAGSGITPVISLIKDILRTEPHSTFTLVYGNRTLQSVIFKEEIEGLKNRYMERLQVIHILSREKLETEINNGRIDSEKCRQLFEGLVAPEQMNHFFLCGPEDMILQVKSYLISKAIPESKIHFELFHTGQQNKANTWQKEHEKEDGNLCTVTIKVDDRTYDIQLAHGGETILDAALKSGADLPYACKGGVCCTCRAKVIKGEVEMEVNYALEKD
ncbi:MAG TPA: FAD-binding oxidoreductase, partial [Chitinophagaceae bacterium]|nr:FAD-binding oxidoreductase [Chitinophagaceae bacterium]